MATSPDLQQYYLRNDVPMVTGATGGIGRRLTERLTHTPEGGIRNVIAFARNPKKAEELGWTHRRKLPESIADVAAFERGKNK